MSSDALADSGCKIEIVNVAVSNINCRFSLGGSTVSNRQNCHHRFEFGNTIGRALYITGSISYTGYSSNSNVYLAIFPGYMATTSTSTVTEDYIFRSSINSASSTSQSTVAINSFTDECNIDQLSLCTYTEKSNSSSTTIIGQFTNVSVSLDVYYI